MTEELSSMTSPEGDDATQSLWLACAEQLAQELPEQLFNTWIKPLTAQVAPDFSKVTLQVANRFKLDWIRAQYAARIAAILENLYGQPVAVELAIAQRANVVRTYVRAGKPVGQLPAEAAPQASESTAPAPQPEPAAQEAAHHSRLNPALTFATLVEGTA
ncbi:MAG: chromosomal replication initiator protein DnaA, partial [Acidovorax sp.]|nr:chromosomal replication initiator protein DnaA [Acidovorax sp.]